MRPPATARRSASLHRLGPPRRPGNLGQRVVDRRAGAVLWPLCAVVSVARSSQRPGRRWAADREHWGGQGPRDGGSTRWSIYRGASARRTTVPIDSDPERSVGRRCRSTLRRVAPGSTALAGGAPSGRGAVERRPPGAPRTRGCPGDRSYRPSDPPRRRPVGVAAPVPVVARHSADPSPSRVALNRAARDRAGGPPVAVPTTAVTSSAGPGSRVRQASPRAGDCL